MIRQTVHCLLAIYATLELFVDPRVKGGIFETEQNPYSLPRIVDMRLTVALAAVVACSWLALASLNPAQGGKKVENRVFEMRTYYAHPGKMKDLHARFRNHTCKLFEKHGMTLIGFWSPTDEKVAEEKMVYVLAYPSKAAADASWKAFRDDPEWKKAREASEVNGPLVARVESLWMTGTDYSKIK